MCACKHVHVQIRNVKNNMFEAKYRKKITIKWKTLLLDPLFSDDHWKYIFSKDLFLYKYSQSVGCFTLLFLLVVFLSTIILYILVKLSY